MRATSDEDFHFGPHKHCDVNTFETKSGVFSFYPMTRKNRAGAGKFCRDKGEILAPITNWDDFWQVKNFTDGCTNFGGGRIYATGLDFVDDKIRYFTNGEIYDEAVHGGLYGKLSGGNYPKWTCFYALFGPRYGSYNLPVFADKRCWDREHGFMCLKPAVKCPSGFA